VEVRWTRDRTQHIATRSHRYPDSIDIDVEWTSEAAADPRAMVIDPDPRSGSGAIRIVGYSPTAGFVLTVIAARIEGELWVSRRGRRPVPSVEATRRHTMTMRSETEIDQQLAPIAVEYLEEEHAAAEEESREAAASAVFSVRLAPATYDAVRAAAERSHTTPSALIRQWVNERIEETSSGDLATAVATLRRDVERVANLVRPA
jgi:predicted HicB family RNase H-like nuclease